MNTKRTSVLIVDDIETNRDMLKRRLQHKDFDVTTAEGGRQALAMLADRNFDVVLLDIMMPSMDGWAVIKILKGDPETATIPIIINTMADQQNQADAEGVIAYLCIARMSRYGGK